jgi:hypothetical protein
MLMQLAGLNIPFTDEMHAWDVTVEQTDAE